MITIEEFIRHVEDNLTLKNGSIKPDERFRDAPYWDSMSLLTILAVFDEDFGKQLSMDDLKRCSTFSEIYSLAVKNK